VIYFLIRPCLAGGLLLAGIGLAAEPAPFVADAKPGTPNVILAPVNPVLTTSLPVLRRVKPVPEPVLPEVLARENAAVGEVHALPRFMVRDSPPPKTADLLTQEGKLDRYLGPRNGFDRGLLNKVVLNWGSEQAQVSLFGAMKNETRAKIVEEDVLRLSRRVELLDLAKTLNDTGDEELAKQLKRQSAHFFVREPPFSRK